MQTTLPKTQCSAEQARPDNTSSRSPLAKAMALVAMSLGLGVVQLDITIVNTALSSIGASLGGSVAELQWVVTSYTIAFAAFILTAGALGDRVGAKRIFHRGLCDLHVGFARLRAGAVGDVPDRRALRAGPGGGDPGAELADAAQSRLCRSEGRAAALSAFGPQARASH